MHLKPLFFAVVIGLTLCLPTPELECGETGKAAGDKDASGTAAGKSGKATAREPSKNGKNGKESPESTVKAENDSFSVVQIGYDVRVVKSSEISALRDKTETDHKAALKSFEEAKKAATKARKKFSSTKPVKPVFKTIASALKSEADAKTRRDKEAVKAEAQKKKAKEEAANQADR